MAQDPQLKKLATLADEYAKRQKEIDDFETKHSKIFSRLKELQDARSQSEVRVKDLARRFAPETGTSTVLKKPWGIITVQAKQRGLEYDATKARENWPKKVYTRCRLIAIDPKEVEACLQEGLMEDEDAEKAALPREKMTPAVSIKVK